MHFSLHHRTGRVQLLLLALCCALVSVGCVTSTIVLEVTRSDDGQHLVGQSMALEFNKQVWDALAADDKQSLTDFPAGLKKQGWQVQTSAGGRIINASKDPVAIQQLALRGWKIQTSKSATGSIVTATLPSLSLFGAAASDPTKDPIRNVVLVVDESDPQGARYTYGAEVHFDLPAGTVPTPAQSSGAGSDTAHSFAEWAAMVDQSAQSDPKIQHLQQALKDAGPPKLTLGVRLPGPIDSATINGTPDGTVVDNSVQWAVSLTKAGTYRLAATAGQRASVELVVSSLEIATGVRDGLLHFGDTAAIRVGIMAQDKTTKNRDLSKLNPVGVKLYYDGTEINQAETDNVGAVAFSFSPPETTLAGRTKHQLKVVAGKQGLAPVESTLDIEVARGLEPVGVAVDYFPGVYVDSALQPGEQFSEMAEVDKPVTVSGRVSSTHYGLVQSAVEATIAIVESSAVQLDAGGAIHTTTDADGNFSVQYYVKLTPAEFRAGLKSLKVIATPKDADHYDTGAAALTIAWASKGSLQVTAVLNKSIYGPADPIELTGQVQSRPQGGALAPAQASVDVLVDDVPIGSAPSGVDGHYAYRIPVAAAKSLAVHHMVKVVANVAGFDQELAVAYFRLVSESDACRAEEMLVSFLAGPTRAYLRENETVLPNGSAFGGLLQGSVALGGAVSEGVVVYTEKSSRATFTLLLGGGKQALIALGPGTTLTVSRMCRDSSGTLKVVLGVRSAANDNAPGQILVNWPQGANADLRIITARGEVSNVHTRYLVSVDGAGTTSVATLEGTARLSDTHGAGVDVDAGKQLTLRQGQSLGAASAGAMQGQVDPRLIAMLAPPGAVTGNAGGAGGNTLSTAGNSPAPATAARPPGAWLLVVAAIAVLLVAAGLVFARRRPRRATPGPPAGPPRYQPASAAPWPAPPPAEPFRQAQEQYGRLRQWLAAGRLTPQQFDQALQANIVRDAWGRYWALGKDNGRWYVFDGQRWVSADPPGP